jgi:hypothetical protein
VSAEYEQAQDAKIIQLEHEKHELLKELKVFKEMNTSARAELKRAQDALKIIQGRYDEAVRQMQMSAVAASCSPPDQEALRENDMLKSEVKTLKDSKDFLIRELNMLKDSHQVLRVAHGVC